MTQLQQKFTLPAAMAEKLNVVRRRTLRVRLGTAIVTAIGVLMAAMGVAMLVDWLATIYDFRWRALLTYSAWTAAAATLLAWAAAAWRHTRQVDRMAAKVDREIPELEERWSTVTALSSNGQSTEVHPAMLKQVSTEAQSWTPRVEVDRVVPLDGLVRALLFLTAITTILGIAVVFNAQRTTVLLKRFWQPYTPISATEVIDLPGKMFVGRGESLEIAANLVGAPVDEASLLLKSEDGELKTVTLVPRGDSQDQLAHRLRAVKEPLQYRVRAGDGQTPWYEIVVADRPQLANVRMELTPPAYTRKDPKIINKLPRRVTALEGTHVKIALQPKQALQSLQLKLGAERAEELSADEQGWYRWETTLTKSFAFQPLLTEEHGLGNLRPPTCEIKCRADKPPIVKILTPNSEMAVRPDDTIPVTFVASDDVGVHHAELIVYDEGQKVDGKPVVLDRIQVPLGDQQGNVKVKATVELDLSQYKTTDGSELSFSIRVREDRGQEMLAGGQSDQDSVIPLVAQDASETSEEGSQAAITGIAQTPPANDQKQEVQRQDDAPDAQVASNESASSDGMQEASDAETSRTAAGQDQISESAQTDSSNQTATSEPNTASNSSQAGNDGRDKPSNSPDQIAESASNPADEENVASANKPAEPNTPSDESRTTATNRRSLNTSDSASPPSVDEAMAEPPADSSDDSTRPMPNESAAENPNDQATQSETEAPKGDQASQSESSPQASQQPKQDDSNSDPSRSNAANKPNQPNEESPQDSTPSPGNPMTKRGLDVEEAQSANSQRMRLKIDEWAGSYDGQQREKLEVSIAPKLEALDRALEKAQSLSRAILDDADAGKSWASKHDRDTQRADEQIEAALKVVDSLETETYGTPYAFIGLQLVDISQAHVGPARRDFWQAMQSDGAARVESVRDGWQHTTRARELLTMLTQRFERTKIEYKMAASVEKIKKMYRVFVEDSMGLLKPDDDEGSRYSRKRVEFELDDEYLARLDEVMEMRAEMRAELARILAEDPRLLRRFLDSQRSRQNIIRNELDRLIERQSELNRETRAWEAAEDDQRPKLAQILLGRHIESAQDVAIAASELHDRFETWSPLGKEVDDPEFKATAEVLQEIATATRELSADGLNYVADSTRAKKLQEESDDTTEDGDAESETPENPFNPNEAVEQISADAQQLYERFTQLEVLLRQIGSRQDRVDIAFFATNRLVETRRLIEQTSAWVRQLKQQQAGKYHRSAEVWQYRLAMETDSMAGKLADVEQRLAGLMQNQEGMLPEAMANKARALLATLDEQAAPNQLAAVYALRRNQLPRATSRQESALKGLELAGKLYDEMVEESIKELDKLPVQDPIASLLDDPTLDELLRELEQEIPLEEVLGIPRRPSNLQIMSDWLRTGGDNAVMTGGNARMMMDQMRQQEQMRQRQLDKAYQRAVARALKEAEAEDLIKNMPKLARETSDWNRLASQLEDDLRQGADKAPPERYRRAIEQYFRQVSGSKQESE